MPCVSRGAHRRSVVAGLARATRKLTGGSLTLRKMTAPPPQLRRSRRTPAMKLATSVPVTRRPRSTSTRNLTTSASGAGGECPPTTLSRPFGLLGSRGRGGRRRSRLRGPCLGRTGLRASLVYTRTVSRRGRRLAPSRVTWFPLLTDTASRSNNVMNNGPREGLWGRRGRAITGGINEC
jgi:hypothetical protein